jgi:LDH2 family malate/lactate/ureidoglycolate dehydrogenase
MPPSFKPQAQDTVRVSGDALRRIVSDVFQKLSVPPEDARQAADVLVSADEFGVDSHGVSNYLEHHYVGGLAKRQINPLPAIRTVHETPVSATVEGDGGMGLVVGTWAMLLAVRKARQTGVGLVAVRNSRHYGMAQYYSRMALPEEMIGISMTNASPIVLPAWGREARLGTNPISVAVPADKQLPFVLDMATSAVAMGKIMIADRLGERLPLGWAADGNGAPTQDAATARAARKLLPLGGTPEGSSHKGYGLALVVDIFSGLLSGWGGGTKITSATGVGHFFGAFRIDCFRPAAEFKRDMDAYLLELLATPPAPGHERVIYPGVPEHETWLERRREGIPLHRDAADMVRRVAAEFGVPFPI